MAFWKKLVGGAPDKPANEPEKTVAAEASPISGTATHTEFTSVSDISEAELPPVSSVVGVCCFVGSQTFKLNEADATKAYVRKNPKWPGTFRVAVFHASKPLSEKLSPEQASTVACLNVLGERGLLKNNVIVMQTMFIRNASPPGERIPLCFATVFGSSGKTQVLLLEEDEIPY